MYNHGADILATYKSSLLRPLTFKPDISQRISVLCVLFLKENDEKIFWFIGFKSNSNNAYGDFFPKAQICLFRNLKVSPTQRRVFTGSLQFTAYDINDITENAIDVLTVHWQLILQLFLSRHKISLK